MTLEKLRELGVAGKKSKCIIFCRVGEYMGHIGSKNRVRTNLDKVQAITNAPAPKNVKEVESYLGCINYYSKYIPDITAIASPLYALLKKDTVWNWGPPQEKSFNLLIESLSPLL